MREIPEISPVVKIVAFFQKFNFSEDSGLYTWIDMSLSPF